MVAGLRLGPVHFGFVNYQHIGSGEIQGKFLFEPLGTITLPCSGEVAFFLTFGIIVSAGCMALIRAKRVRKMKAKQYPPVHDAEG